MAWGGIFLRGVATLCANRRTAPAVLSAVAANLVAVDIAALIVATVSAVFTGGSLWYARGQKDAAEESADAASRSATAAEESAKSSQQSADAAVTVSTIEQQREHRENRPPVELRFEKWLSEPNAALLNAENLSGQPVDVTVELVDGHRLAGFEDEPGHRATTYRFEALRPGVPEVATFSSVDTNVWTDSTVKFLVTVKRSSDAWDGELVSVTLPKRTAKTHLY